MNNEKVYSNYNVFFDEHGGVFVRASSFARAVEAAMQYINNGFARLYTGKPPVTLDDLNRVVCL